MHLKCIISHISSKVNKSYVHIRSCNQSGWGQTVYSHQVEVQVSWDNSQNFVIARNPEISGKLASLIQWWKWTMKEFLENYDAFN